MRMLKVSALLVLLCLCAQASAQDGQKKDEPKSALDRYKDKVAQEIEQGWARAPVEERESVTRGKVKVQGRSLAYVATAGTTTIRDEVGKPTASLFYTAYTLEGADPSSRPVTFLYNGGPGSPTVWLHMGSFGPYRVVTDEPEAVRPAPFAFGPNEQTLLDKTDLVFIDMVGAGYSRPLGDTPGAAFWGVDQDVDAFARAILRYTTKFNRWRSPKYLLGESYGTTRSGALAYQLQSRGMALNGVILLSSIMNYGARQPGMNMDAMSLFPSYAAVAWYHKRVDTSLPLEAFVQRAREFALGPYASALAKGHMISVAERAEVARQMSAFIGLSPGFIENANLRVDLSSFRKELLRDQRFTVGRFDGRYKGIDSSAEGDSPEFDASSTAVTGAYVGLFSDYVRSVLKYETDLTYLRSARDLYGPAAFNWDWNHRPPVGRPQSLPNTAVDLARAMRENPHLKVLSLNGYYDMATPFLGTEFDLAQTMLDPAQKNNLEFAYYEGGHMMYLNPSALVKLREDLVRFYDETRHPG